MAVLESNEAPASASWPALRGGRIVAIDIFRALTVLVMITVNTWGGVAGLPAWMRHMPANADAMSFVDAVFPAFLFIVGMSIPFALQQRQRLGDSTVQLQLQVLQRALGLVLIGVFMVNAEGGFHAASMPLPITAWTLLIYLAAFGVWGSLRGGPALARSWRWAGLGLFALLAWLYRGGADGQSGMSPQWWGILGLIGWAYLIGCAVYMLARGRLGGVLLGLVFSAAYATLHWLDAVQASPGLALLFSQNGHFAHAVLVLSGCATALLFYGTRSQTDRARLWLWALAFAVLLALAAALLRPEFKVSKILATPSWALYSAAACVLIFAALAQWVDGWGRNMWPALLEPVAANPLLAYLIPFVVGAAMGLVGWSWPELFSRSPGGVIFGLVYALLVAAAVKWLAARGVRLRI
ncbi:DUF5009 domain-containing protein [Paucibacter sp. DJ2R-2]|uniref:DUF5009 domain-containing protein n=1 Tax=Paucibacter sp. DJ2R-2 TaxID=2893558 RepID=UPI0021E38F72|nr:DUF5009 domain-containing protein [Paucibacter sp. DJ2R-2]MCV2422061.1 DUF5009 domain-containing protein [Paucibacter sp. DJ4R-1]MCV2439322.1 DUF5009 domain-containing protein [Paucibacter sp. DJ2R-2]